MPDETKLRQVAGECVADLRKRDAKTQLAGMIEEALVPALPDWEKLLKAIRSAWPEEQEMCRPLVNAITSGGKGGFYKPGDKLEV